MSATKRYHVVYRGNVQGVGFRFTASRIAANLNITGFVKNAADGTVEIVCEGPADQLETFLKNVNENMYGCISDRDIKGEPATGTFSGFEIKL